MIIDTGAVSALFEGEAGIQRLLGDSVRHHLPVIVLGEYRFGLKRSRKNGPLTRLLDILEKESIVLDIDSETSRFYAEIRERLREQGQPIPENDIWIASLAIQHGLTIASRDAHFDNVKGVKRHPW
jgi:tRNA(fMet)-specific endonuclease VapC